MAHGQSLRPRGRGHQPGHDRNDALDHPDPVEPARRLRQLGRRARLGRFLTMQREAVTPRPGWERQLEGLGFRYYVMGRKAYWAEAAFYAFTFGEIDQLAGATRNL